MAYARAEFDYSSNTDGSINTTTYTVGSTAWKLDKILAVKNN
jgi:hypothetical protein